MAKSLAFALPFVLFITISDLEQVFLSLRSHFLIELMVWVILEMRMRANTLSMSKVAWVRGDSREREGVSGKKSVSIDKFLFLIVI